MGQINYFGIKVNVTSSPELQPRSLTRRIVERIWILWLKLIHKKKILYSLNEDLITLGVNIGLIPITKSFKNWENLSDFNFTLPYSCKKEGISAILRVKNEEQKIIYCLTSIYDVFDEIVFIDNLSTDKTLEFVSTFKDKYDSQNKIKVYKYPHRISRCGSENSETPENSIQNLAYYYNWALSHCSFKYACKWDADMIFIKERKSSFRSFFNSKLLPSRYKVLRIKGQTIYRDFHNNYFVSASMNTEPRIFPFSYLNHYVKTEVWEDLMCQPPLLEEDAGPAMYYELKFISEDELSHWSPNLLAKPDQNPLDRRGLEELRTLESLKSGQIDENSLTPIASDFLPSLDLCDTTLGNTLSNSTLSTS